MAQLHERQTNQSLKCSLFISKDFLMSRSIVVLWSYNVPPVIHMIMNKTVSFFLGFSIVVVFEFSAIFTFIFDVTVQIGKQFWFYFP